MATIACEKRNSLTPSDAAVLNSYQKVYEALTADSMQDVSANASAIANAVKSDPNKKFPMAIADQAEKLAKDSDIKATRENFKGLSSELISYLDKEKIKGIGFRENYCPMAEASWLQKG